jgi:hypothetical protein
VQRKPYNLELRRGFFSNRVIEDWNALPAEIIQISVTGKFKAAYKNAGQADPTRNSRTQRKLTGTLVNATALIDVLQEVLEGHGGLLIKQTNKYILAYRQFRYHMHFISRSTVADLHMLNRACDQ